MRTPNLADLLSVQAIFGGNFHLLREGGATTRTYSLVRWEEKDVFTVPVSKLSDPNSYVKAGRLNEVLCHEVKEKSLRNLGRVGVPVDPSFSLALGAAVKFKHDRAAFFEATLPDTFVAAIRVEGNHNNETRYVLSQEAISWIENEIEKFRDAQGVLPLKLPRIVEFFGAPDGVHFTLDANGKNTVANNSLRVRFLDAYVPPVVFQGEYELVLFARPRSR